MNPFRFLGVVLCISTCPGMAAGAINDWTKPASGYWEEPFWSLGRLPGPGDTVMFGNPGWKALAIGANTTANFPGSLTVSNLTIVSPPDSHNVLLLNYAGLNVPLSVSSDFILGTNSALVSYYSALQGGNLFLSSPAAFSVNATVTFDKIELESDTSAELDLTNATLSADLLLLGPSGTMNQAGGSSQVSNLVMFAGTAATLSGGLLVVSNLDLQTLGGTGLAQFTMVDGFMDVLGVMTLGRQQFVFDARGQFLLQAGFFRAREMDFLNGTFTQTGGTNVTQKMAVPSLDFSHGDYFLSGGALVSSNLTLGAVLNPSIPPGSANFVQSGGVHSNINMQLYGEIRRQSVTRFGNYSLNAGLLVSDSIQMLGGAFTLAGGTSYVRELTLDEAAAYSLAAGTLVTSNTTVTTCCCVPSLFIQAGGSHTVQTRLLLQDFIQYRLTGGSVFAPIIEVDVGAEFFAQGGVINNPGLFLMRGGALRAGAAGGQSLQLGKLQVIGDPFSGCVSTQPVGPTLDMGAGPGIGPTVLRFLDSRDVPWSGAPLLIVNWSPTTNGFGPDQVFVGDSAQALTAAQLSQVKFVNPFGWAPGTYSARILSTGELVPAVPPLLTFARTANALVLSWPGDAQLLAATNVTGPYLTVPGATSPFTNFFTAPQQFFRLSLTLP